MSLRSVPPLAVEHGEALVLAVMDVVRRRVTARGERFDHRDAVVSVVVVVTGGSGESSARRAEALNVAASAHAHASAIVCLTFIERSPRIRSHATVPQWWPLVVRVVRRSPAARVSKLRDKSHEAGVGLRPR